MSVYKIPISDNPNQQFSVVLENRNYDITLQWNVRDESWYMVLGLSGLSPIFKTKIVNGIDLLRKYRAYQDVPKGMMYVYDNAKQVGRLTRDGFSSGRFTLYYLTENSRLLFEDLGT
jgi:hypothetical protein